MCPELCARKLLNSPETQTWPICFSSSVRTLVVNWLTVRTRRALGCENKSPKSHCDFTSLPMCRSQKELRLPWLRNPLNLHGSPRRGVNVDQSALEQDVLFRNREPLRQISQEPLDDWRNFAPEHAFM